MSLPIKMRDTLLSVDVDLYQIGLPDPFGANVLICFDGRDNKGSHLSSIPELSALNNNVTWITTNIKRLEPLKA